ncbi:MAG: peptidylprolyl isomerase [Proteobacteria bacterium]|nr:peptidylprolyl isomerase [Pseudomonadota bacterium]
MRATVAASALICGVVLCTLLPAASRSFAQVQTIDKVVAIVDDDIILASELQERLGLIKRNLEQRNIELPPDDVLYRETLDRLILESIQLQLANRYGVRIPDAQLDEAMGRMAGGSGMTLDQFRMAVEEQGQSYFAMREEIRREMMIQRVQQGNVSRNIQISDQEVDNFMATEEGEAMTQPEFRVVQALIEVSKNDPTTEVQRKEDFVDGVLASILAGAPFQEAVSVMEPYAFAGGDLGYKKINDIPSMFAGVIPSLKIGDTAKVESGAGFHLVYLADARGRERLVEQTEVRHILVKPTEVLNEEQARDLAVLLKERINAGEAFGDLAKEYSDDIGSAQEGGELGWTNPGQMVPEFESAMAAAELNEITEPVRSQFGWHILEVTGRREQDIADDIRRRQVMGYLHDQKYEEELDAWLRKIREEAFVDIK